MCLAVPGKIIKIENDKATVDYQVEKRIAVLLDDSFIVGDYVVVQGGIVIVKVEEQEAKNALELYAKALS